MIGLSLTLSASVWGQKSHAKTNNLIPFSYQTFGCDNKGYFNPSQYKKEELEGTCKLIYPLSMSPFTSLMVFKPAKLDEVRKNGTQLLQQLEKEYLGRKKELSGLKIINLPIWKKQYEEVHRSLDNEYQLTKELLMGYADPTTLKNSKFKEVCKRYIDALTTTDKPQKYSGWKSLFEDKGSKAEETFAAKWNAPRKDDYALIDLMNAFNNCANHSFRPKPDEEGTLYETFDKIFTKLKKNCDEP